MWAILTSILSALLGIPQWLRSRADKQTGRQEQQISDDTATLKDADDAKVIQNAVFGQPVGDALKWLRSHGKP